MHNLLTNLGLRARLLHRAWRYRLRVERPEILFTLRHLAPGQTAVDIGAHKGAFTYWMSRAVGPAGRVLAFEPIPQLADYLKQVRLASGLANIQVVPQALSNRQGMAELCIPESGHLGTTTLNPRGEVYRPLEVTVDTLDSFCTERSLRPIHFIKCDVEGHELEVFQGAERILREDRPVMLFECADCFHEDGQVGRVLPYLQQLGYRGFFFFRGEVKPISEFRLEIHQARPTDKDWCPNFAFLPEASQP